MEQRNEDLLVKFKSIFSSLICGIILWVTRLSSSMQPQKPYPRHHRLQLGLGTLFCSTSRNFNRGATVIHSYMVPSSPSSASSWSSSSSSSSLCFRSSSISSSSWPSTMGDLIGAESGVYMSSNEDSLATFLEKAQLKKKLEKGTKTKREIPPPIPSLSRKPWVLSRHYIDGRLVIKQERVKNFEYFEAKRENGRLVLNLIPLHDDDDSILCENEELEKVVEVDEEENENSMDEDFEGNKNQNEDEQQNGDMMILASSMPEPWVETKRGITELNNMRRCFTYAGKEMSNSSFFRMPIPVNKPIGGF